MRFSVLLLACAIAFCTGCTDEPAESSVAVNSPPPPGALDLDTLRSATYGVLDSVYQSAMHVDSSRAYFKSEAAQDAWFRRWQTMLYALSDYLKQNGVTWNNELRIFSRVYFNQQGGIDHYLYSIKQTGPGYPGPALRDSLRMLLTSFTETYRMDSAIGGKVAQCGPVVLMPPQ